MSPHGHGHRDRAHGAERSALTRRAALASVSMALFLVALKVWASWETGSVAMLGSLADTALDLVASLVTFFGVRWAAMPADAEHRFGHGKAEALAALVQVILITVSALGIAWRSIDRLHSGSAFGGWLHRIGVNVWLQSLRKAGRETELLDEEAPDPVNVAQGAEQRIDLDRALDRLTPAERLCVVLSHAERFSHGEIAQATGLPLGTVNSHVRRGTARLRVLLAVEGTCHERA